MSEQRLDLSGKLEWSIPSDEGTESVVCLTRDDGPHEYDSEDLFCEALRAQASEDALRERVRELEDAINVAINEMWDVPKTFTITHLRQALGGGKESV
jgi:hypothetical protein